MGLTNRARFFYCAAVHNPDGRDAELSGMEAFTRYAMPMGELIAAAGGSFRFSGAVEGLLIGDVRQRKPRRCRSWKRLMSNSRLF